MENYPRYRLYAVQRNGSLVIAGDFISASRARRSWRTKTRRGLSASGIAGVIVDTTNPAAEYVLA